MSSSTPILASWLDTIINSIGQVLPNVTVIVLAGTVAGTEEVDTATQPGSPLATIYSDPYGNNPIDQVHAPLNTSAGDGTFQFWAPAGYYVIQAYGPGIIGQLVYGISLSPSTGQGLSFADAETPSGTINGTNKSFTLANAPNPAASLILVQNGFVLVQGTHYTLSGRNITFANAPATGDTLQAWYRH